jgi:hypothetical protein
MQIFEFKGADGQPVQTGATCSLTLEGGNVDRCYLRSLHVINSGGDGFAGMSVSGLLADNVTWVTAIDSEGNGIAGDLVNPRVIIMGADYLALRVDVNQGQDGVTSVRAALIR